MEALLHLNTVQNHSARSLRRMYDEVESHARSLNSLGVLPESYGSVVASTLLNKLPHDVRLIVSRGVSDAEWDLECFLKPLNDEIDARERAVSTQKIFPNSQSALAGNHIEIYQLLVLCFHPLIFVLIVDLHILVIPATLSLMWTPENRF